MKGFADPNTKKFISEGMDLSRQASMGDCDDDDEDKKTLKTDYQQLKRCRLC